MAWKISKSLVRGEIDNRQAGRITGRFWLLGRDAPVELDLKGNPLRDLAGCQVSFANPAPETGDDTRLQARQEGPVGDITGSRKVRVPDVPFDEVMRLAREKKPVPEHVANCLSVEWFDEHNGRVVIESPDYQVTVSPPAWRMTDVQAQEQAEGNKAVFRAYLEKLAGTVDDDSRDADGAAEDADDDYKPMNEFQWEKFMKESDRRTDKYMELLDKYEGHPDQEKIVAREMGWTWLEEALEADEQGKLDDSGTNDEETDDEPDVDDDFEMVPNPLTEGVDWVMDESGDAKHPLVIRMQNVAMGMWHTCKDRGLLEEGGDADLHDMIFQGEMTGAKLAGALNSLAYDRHHEGGFVVACLKRALGFLHKALGATDLVEAKNILHPGEVAAYRNDLFQIREEILKLMDRFRNQG